MGYGVFGIGVSGLLAAQQQLNTVGHNIANVNTKGYSRQKTEVSASIPNFSGAGYIGTGVKADTTRRYYNEFLERQIRDSNSQLGKFDRFYQLASQIDNILANPDAGLTPTLEAFYNALQEANDAPASVPARSVLLTSAQTLTDRFSLLQDRFNDLTNQTNSDLADVTAEITSRAISIAELNKTISAQVGASTGNLPNDAMDKREQLIKEISALIDVNVVYQDNNVANIYIGSGQPLVVNATAYSMSVVNNEFTSQNKEIILTNNNGSINITEQITGGELQGLLDFKNKVLEPSYNALGRIAASITKEMNEQHNLGMTLRQNTIGGYILGGDFFEDIIASQQANRSTNNASTESMFVKITDTTVLTTSDYEVEFSSAGGTFTYTAKRLSDNTVFTGTGTTATAALSDLNTNLVDEGIELSESGALTNGDRFLVRPSHELARQINVQVNDVLDIALASPVVASSAQNSLGVGTNTGTGKIEFVPFEAANGPLENIPITSDQPTDPTYPTYTDITLTFNGTGFDVASTASPAVPVGPIAYNPSTDSGKTLNLGAPYDNVKFIITGTPNTGDQFILSNNTAPQDDNRNGLIMANIQSKKTIQDSSADFQRAYGLMVADVGTYTHSSEVDLRAQQALNDQALQNRDSLSGVNLDEEASDLLRFQQAYQASSKVITVANEMFSTLLNSV